MMIAAFPERDSLAGDAGGAMFHVAPRRCRVEIQAWGLHPDSGAPRNHPWSERLIYLWTSEQAAAQWNTPDLRGYDEPTDVWRIDPAALTADTPVADPYSQQRPGQELYTHSRVTDQPIEPQHLTLVSSR